MKLKSVMALMAGLVMAVDVSGAELRLHNYFTDNMVLQMEKPVLVKGWADAGAKVTVTFGDQNKTATAGNQGAWSVTLDAMKASSSGRKMVVSSSIGNPSSPAGSAATGQQLAIGNILVGDVLVFARQSSIDVSLGRDEEGKKAAQGYEPTPLLRTMRIKTITGKDPQEDLDKKAVSGWAQVDKNSALTMTATAFYLGRDLAGKVNVPVGIVDIDMGYQFAAAWLSTQALDEMEKIYTEKETGDLRWLRRHLPAEADKWASGETQRNLDKYYEESLKKSGAAKPSLGMAPLDYPYYPSACYNTVIHPLSGIAAKGILLQLGNDYLMLAYSRIKAMGKITDPAELDTAWAQNYFFYKYGNRMTPTTLPLVPGDWRRAFGEKELPIGLIMPPGSDFYFYGGHNREVRELQRRMQQDIAGLGLIMPGTEHIPLSGEPADERLLAERCEKWVLGTLYGQKVASSGPVFDRMEIANGEVTIFYREGTSDGLKAEGKALDQFEVAGPDGQFVQCKARIEANTVKLASDNIFYNMSVRYNWNHKPDQGLVNSSGLPALPFTTLTSWVYNWWPGNPAAELPEEYHTTANKWPKRDVAIINGGNILAGGDSQPNPNDLGPTGIQAAPFGPNLYVHGTLPGTPADGKIFQKDLIYGVYGKDFGTSPDDKYRQFSAAITQAETREGGGKLILNVRRAGQNIAVEIKLNVLGSYSSTTPYYCPKSEKIVEMAEEWMARLYRPASGPAGNPVARFNGDLFFLMASGKPEYQGLVRRAVYSIIQQMNTTYYKNFILGYDALLLGEYYHWTGDANILPYLKAVVDNIARNQIQPPHADPTKYAVATTDEQVGGWRIRFGPGIGDITYGLMPAAGMPCVMGLVLANEAGVDIDKQALKWGIDHYYKGRAEYGYVEYQYSNLRLKEPRPIDPEAEAKGMAQNMNGKLGTAAALFSMLDGYGTATEICSRNCVYSFNRTRIGHGGMFFNNFWAPIGANAAGEQGFKHFMKGQTWWRELYRRHDGGFNQAGFGGIGVAYALPYVAHHKRLRMLGAPRSAFGPNPPAYLKPALEAHAKRDYARAEELIVKLMDASVVPAAEKSVAEHFLESIQVLRKSVEHDLAYTEKLIKDGRYEYAAFELPQLKGVVAVDNPRLLAIGKALESPEGKQLIAKMSKELAQQQAEENRVRQAEEQEAMDAAEKKAGKPDEEGENALNAEVRKALEADSKRVWARLTPTRNEVPENEATGWRMMVLETRKNAPDGWMKPGFDDSTWDKTTMPISWRVSHDALFRGTFKVDDKKAFDAVRITCRLFHQENVDVYINGELVAKINGAGSDISVPLTDYALKILRNGENTVAFVTSHQERWGKVRGDYVKVDGGGIRFGLEAGKPPGK